MWKPAVVAILVAGSGGVALVGQASIAYAQVQGLDDVPREDHVGPRPGPPQDRTDRARPRERHDRLFADRDRCRGLDCDRRQPGRDRHEAHHGDHGWRHEWRDFDPRDSRSWGYGESGRNLGSRGYGTHHRDYGGGEIDGPPRGLGLPYWAPD